MQLIKFYAGRTSITRDCLVAYTDSEPDEADPEPNAVPAQTAAAPADSSRPKVSVRKMDDAQRSEYFKDKHLKRQNIDEQKKLVGSQDFPWLCYNEVRGFHCAVCVRAPNFVRSGDKLSTSGYLANNPIPTMQKLKDHCAPGSKHNDCVKREKELEQRPQRAVEGDIRIHGTVTSEDELYFKTIRTIHTIATEQLGLTRSDEDGGPAAVAARK